MIEGKKEKKVDDIENIPQSVIFPINNGKVRLKTLGCTLLGLWRLSFAVSILNLFNNMKGLADKNRLSLRLGHSYGVVTCALNFSKLHFQ